MSFDQRSMRSNPSLMLSLDDPKSTMGNNTQMHASSFRIVHQDVTDDNATTSAWATLLNSEGFEERNDRMHLKMEQTETPTVAESRPPAYNVVQSHRKIEAMITLQIDCTTKQMVSKETTTVVAESMHDVMHRMYEIACNWF